jgi:hypothetical protein
MRRITHKPYAARPFQRIEYKRIDTAQKLESICIDCGVSLQSTLTLMYKQSDNRLTADELFRQIRRAMVKMPAVIYYQCDTTEYIEFYNMEDL